MIEEAVIESGKEFGLTHDTLPSSYSARLDVDLMSDEPFRSVED